MGSVQSGSSIIPPEPGRILGGNTGLCRTLVGRSASTRELSLLVAEGKFREDLFILLNDVSIEVPSLHELSNLVERCSILTSSAEIDIDDLPRRIRGVPVV